MAAAAAATELEKRQAFRFFDLPPELRNMVYAILYGERRDVKLLSRASSASWENRSRMKKNNRPATFPECCILHQLSINKQFFQEAVKIWTASKVFTDDASTLIECLGDTNSIARQVLQHITEVKLDSEPLYGEMEDITRCLPLLARVTVELRSSGFKNWDDTQVAWETEMSDVELASTRPIGKLLSLRGLRNLTITWDSICHDLSSEERGVLLKNKKQAQAFLNDVVTRAPETPRRELLPTFDQALGAAVAAKSSKAFAMPSSPRSEHEEDSVPSLNDRDIPGTAAEFLRLVGKPPIRN